MVADDVRSGRFWVIRVEGVLFFVLLNKGSMVLDQWRNDIR
jgi:hypothetical protein